MDDIAIQVKGLSKKFELHHRSIKNIISKNIKKVFTYKPGANNNKTEGFYALNNVSFEIIKGETICVIGENGSGKSTLLKVLGGITHPTAGTVEINGTIASVLEIGTGFHPELSGRENIYLNGSLLGMKKTEIDDVFQQIIEFSEIGEFLDMPVKHYSSGMNSRLAFSVVTHFNADILLFDETLSVGDHAFRNKAIIKIKRLSNEGKTIVVVTHLVTDALSFGKRTMLFKKGCLVCFDLSYIAVQQYVDYIKEKSFDGKTAVRNMIDFTETSNVNNLISDTFNLDLCFDKIIVKAAGKLPADNIYLSDSIIFEFYYSKRQDTIKSNIIARIVDNFYNTVFIASNIFCPGNSQRGQYKTSFTLPSYFLNEGLYSLYIIILDELKPVAHIPTDLLTFKIEYSYEDEKYINFPKHPCPIYPEFNWKETLIQKY